MARTSQTRSTALSIGFVERIVQSERSSAGVAGAYDAVFVGVDSGLHAVAQADSGEDVGDVAFDGCLAEVEAGGDLGV
jgi:hypothetical protein